VPEGTIGNSFESYFSYVDPQDLPQVKGKLNSLLTEKDQRAEVEYRVKTAGGETRWLRSAGGKRIDSRGRLVVSGITSDITERKLAEQKLNLAQAHLLQSEKMASIGQLAAGVAHEINNPTGFIMSNLGTLKEYLQTYQKLVGLYEELEKTSASPDTGERERVFSCIKVLREDEDIDFIGEDSVQLLDESLEGTERIRDIVQNLKSFARVDESETKKADLNECLESTLKIVWNELKYKCRVNKKFGDVPAVTCNPGQLNQVFVNLLVNAAHAIPEKGDVTIETYADDRGVYVRIADTGAGIPPEIMSRIFDPFYTTKKQGVGTGLGLSISHGIIEKHGGTIDVASEVGKGTAFTIFLPLANSPADSFGDGNPRIVKDPES
jgi:signal transduction histidine kinase